MIRFILKIIEIEEQVQQHAPNYQLIVLCKGLFNYSVFVANQMAHLNRLICLFEQSA